MKIPFNILSNKYISNISDKDISLLMLCILLHNNKISQKSFTNKLKTYFINDQLKRHINTYKSKVNDKWYQDEKITNIFIDEVENTCIEKNLTIEQYIKYLNIGLNKNKNYCIDLISFNVIKPILNNINNIYNFKSEFNLNEIEYIPTNYYETDKIYDLSSGYCCEDHDGDYETYKQNKYKYYYEQNSIKEISNIFKNILLKYKTHNKNPKDKLLTQW